MLRTGACLLAVAWSFTSSAQPTQQYHPSFADGLREAIAGQLAQRGGGGDTLVIPTVFHVLHQRGVEHLSDERLLTALDQLNMDFSASHPDLAWVTTAFQPVIGDCAIRFELATLDPDGECTHGIERLRRVQTLVGGNTAKGSQWPRDRYLNIWTVRTMPPGESGESPYPTDTEGDQFYKDGVMLLSSAVGDLSSLSSRRTMSHLTARAFNLFYTWGPDLATFGTCGDDDVDDTPVTAGSSGFSCNLNLANCAPPIVENTQNIMDFSSCPLMFTQGQCARMRALLNSPVADRDNLWTQGNLLATGTAPAPTVSCAPVADFFAVVGLSLLNPTVPFNLASCTDAPVRFVDNSHRAFVTAWSWTFEDGTPATSTEQHPTVTFGSPGWKTVSLTVSNDQGGTTKVDPFAVLIGDASTALPGAWYEDFENGSPDLDPLFMDNHDENFTYWQRYYGPGAIGIGCARLSSSLRDPNDTLYNPTNALDIDDLVSPLIDLAVLGTDASLGFLYSSSSQTTDISQMTERLEIQVSGDCGRTWQTRGTLLGPQLAVNGQTNEPGNWTPYTVALPQNILTPHMRLRLRYRSGPHSNDVFIDNLSIGLTVGVEETGELVTGLFPNPTQGLFTLVVRGMDHLPTEVRITDLRGALVYAGVHAPTGAAGLALDTRAIGLAQGMYVLRVSNELGTGGSRLAVTR